MEDKKIIRLRKPVVNQSAVEAVTKVLLSGYLAEGEEVKLFEEEFSQYFQKDNCVSVNSGTSALELAYDLAGIHEGTEVIAPVLTFVGANLSLVRRKAKIIFADIDPLTFNVDPRDIEKKITKNTKAIIFVHFGGNNAGLDEVLEIGRKHNIKIIEDAAQAIGSTNWGKADLTAVSFQAIKVLTTGDGGMLVCKDRADYDRARRLRWFGMDRVERQKTGYSDILEPGYKFHMNNIAGAIGRENLRIMDDVIRQHRSLVDAYNAFSFPSEWNIQVSATIWACRVVAEDWESLRQYLSDNGIENNIYEYRCDIYSVFGGERQGLPEMNKVEKKYFFIPLHYGVSLDDVAYIYQKIKDFYDTRAQ